MALSTVTVTWDENDPTLAGLSGTITFALSSRLDDATDGMSVNPIPETYALASGSSRPLVANDNANALPTGTFYNITVTPDRGQPYVFQAAINAANGATQKLSSLVPLTTPPAMVSSLPLPTGTPTAGQVPMATGTGEASAWTLIPRLVASTGLAGFVLQNATPNILTWTAPNDGQMHRVNCVAIQHVTSAETGGAVGLTFTAPDGTVLTSSLYAGGSGTGSVSIQVDRLIQPGSMISLVQTSALTAGAAGVWAQLWAA